jgi:hypothetical protein
VRIEELTETLDESPFAGAYRVEPVTLAGLPIWLRVTLTKA